MALVFVHGIGNRNAEDFKAATLLRDGHFERYLLPVISSDPHTVPIYSPPWGGHGAQLRWNHACLPGSAAESLGVADGDLLDLAVAAAAPGVAPTGVVTAIARSSMRDAVDLLFTAVDLRDREPEDVSELVELAAQLDSYCQTQELLSPLGTEEERYPWLVNTHDDIDFLDLLLRKASAPQKPGAYESLGGKGTLRRAREILTDAADGLHSALVGAPATATASGARRLFGEPLSLLLGDVFVYLENPKPIVDVVAQALEDALDAAPSGEPLVVVAHSMGGNIVYDILSRFRRKLHVQVLITVGSQVGLFAELGLFQYTRSTGLPKPNRHKIPKLKNVDHWINVVDRSDILGYRVGPIFDGAVDYDYPTNKPWAHSAYFRQPNFHARLAMRVKEVIE
ncbi:hypothetical protein ACWD25_42150 [Streptomyces sp. NPDC002920]